MTGQIDRIEGQVMPVNAFLVHGPDGVVVVDGMLTVSDAAPVRHAIDEHWVPVGGRRGYASTPRPLRRPGAPGQN